MGDSARCAGGATIAMTPQASAIAAITARAIAAHGVPAAWPDAQATVRAERVEVLLASPA